MRQAALALFVAAASVATAAEVEVIQNTGPSSQRIDIAILGDGYTSTQQAKMSDDARTALNGMFLETPYREYRELFNVRLIHVVSNQSGADNGTAGGTRDTALGAYYNCGGIDRLLCVNNEIVMSTAIADYPEFDVAIVIVNDAKYGGAGGSVAVFSTHPSAIDLLLHELSHTIGNLADEYQDEYPGFPACSATTDCPEPNATIRNTRETAKWAAWIDSSTPVPTPEGSSTYANAIGLFEGARYKSAGVYRPKDDTCMMQYLAQPFCSVCREGLIWSFWRRAPVISSLAPGNDATVQVCQGGTLTVQTPTIQGGGYSYLWTIDGVPVAETSNTLTIDASTANGTHTVRVTTRDATGMVRNDPDGLLSQQAEWTVTNCSATECSEVASCNSGACEITPKAAGTSCGVAPTCTNGIATAAGACDGSGQCVPGTPVSCAAYTCDDAGAACRTACSDDDHCSGNNVCAQGVCAAPTTPEVQPGPFSCLGCSSAGGALAYASMLLLALGARRRRP